MSGNFQYQPFVAVSGNLGGKVPVVDHVLSPHEQENYSTTSFDENCIEFEFQTDRNYYVDLRQNVFGFETENCQRSWLRNLQYERIKERSQRKSKIACGSDGGSGAKGSSYSRYSRK